MHIVTVCFFYDAILLVLDEVFNNASGMVSRYDKNNRSLYTIHSCQPFDYKNNNPSQDSSCF